MSGGSMNYLYEKVQYAATFKMDTSLRRAFKGHLDKVATALRAIEWNDSGDGDDSEDDAIRACLRDDAELVQAKADLEAVIREAQDTLKRFGR